MDEKDSKQGLLIVYTGDGKGKTTAALGMTIRAVGYGWKISIIQFIKGSWKYGEIDGLKLLESNVELNIMGEGFVGIVDDDKPFEEHRRAAEQAFDLLMDKMNAGEHDLIIADELNVAVSLGLISMDKLKTLIEQKPDNLHLVITGRKADEWLIEKADLVTEMREIKHPYKKGILAQKGIDF